MPRSKQRVVRRLNPHDALFRAVFSQVGNAASELRLVLPVALSKRIEWSSLQLEEGRFVDLALGSRQSDLLFTVRLEGVPNRIFLLFEHQSTADPMMPFRLLRYMLRIWERWAAENRRSRVLPLIVPVVLSHAVGGWTRAVSLHDLLGAPPDVLRSVAPYFPDLSFVLDDLTRSPDEELAGRAMPPMAILSLLLLRHGRDKRGLEDRLREWDVLWKSVWGGPNGGEAIAIAVRYLMLANKQATRQTLVNTLESILGEGVREMVMTEVQRMVVEGEIRGEARGEAKGRAEDVLAVLAARGLGVSDEQRARILACTDVALLSRWVARAATSQSAAEALAEA